MIFVGIDWAEAHHDICVLDAEGEVLATRRIPEGLDGVARLHALLEGHTERSDEVIVGIETDRGLLVTALLGAGYLVHAIDPLSASRDRERHTVSRAKSDRGDARMLADLVRTDRGHHREVAPDSELLGAIKVLARSHQNLITDPAAPARRAAQCPARVLPRAPSPPSRSWATPTRSRCSRSRPIPSGDGS